MIERYVIIQAEKPALFFDSREDAMQYLNPDNYSGIVSWRYWPDKGAATDISYWNSNTALLLKCEVVIPREMSAATKWVI